MLGDFEVRYDGERNAEILALIEEWRRLLNEAVTTQVEIWKRDRAFEAEVRIAARRGYDPKAAEYRFIQRGVYELMQPFIREIAALHGLLTPTITFTRDAQADTCGPACRR